MRARRCCPCLEIQRQSDYSEEGGWDLTLHLDSVDSARTLEKIRQPTSAEVQPPNSKDSPFAAEGFAASLPGTEGVATKTGMAANGWIAGLTGARERHGRTG